MLPLAIWHHDGRIRDANDAYLKLTGHSRQDLREGRLRCNQLTAPEHLARDERAIRELQSGQAICTPFQKDYICKDLGRIPVLVAAALLLNRRDTGIAFALDLTRYPSAEQALHARKDVIHTLFASVLGTDCAPDVEKLIRLVSNAPSLSRTPELSTLLAHELNQPLGSILANAQSARKLLRQRVPDLQELKGIVSDIIAEDRRASRLIDRICLSVRRKQRSLQSVNVNQLIDEVMRVLRNEFLLGAIQVDFALAPEAPLVRGDRLQLHQLFSNLISNACEALNRMAPAGRKLFIRTHLENESLVSIDLQDTGPGIPAGGLEAIFEPFVSSKPGGMGVGLYICRAIVQSHGGCLWATNHPAGGACFHIRLPVAAAA